MKSSCKILVILVLILTAGSLSLSAQRNMRGMKADSAGMSMHRMQMHRSMQGPDSLMRERMDRRMGHMQMPMCPCMEPMWGMHRRFPQEREWGMRMPEPRMRHSGMYGDRGPDRFGFGMRMYDNIPNLSDKQKKEIADLRQKQHEEMQNLRNDMQKKMQDMRKAHMEKFRSLLTDEQKKWLNENSPEMPQPPEPPETPQK